MQNQKRAPFPLAGGVLTIIGSCFALPAAILSIYISYDWGAYGYGAYPAYILFFGIFGLIAFAFGLAAGIMTLKRIHIVFSIFGVSFLLASGVMMIIAVLVLGLLIMILSILGVIFVALSNKQFSSR